MILSKTTRIIEHLPTIALVGRVNVGKSTLFNRIVEKHQAMVADEPGTTRTSNYGLAYWRGISLRLIDTGGLMAPDSDPYRSDIERQVKTALNEADVILFVIDGTATLRDDDRAIASLLHKTNKRVILVANKIDNSRLARILDEQAWHSLGFKTPMQASATSGRGVGDLLDCAYELLTITQEKNYELPRDTIKVALIGRPNVGKSSLFNALVGEDLVIVSHIPHTTRETFDTLVTWKKQHILFIDTAGIRKRPRIRIGLEQKGVSQSINQIKEADIILFVLDSSEPVTHQDKHLAGLIEESKKPIIIVANKWDITHQNHTSMNFLTISEFSSRTSDASAHYEQYITDVFRFLELAPIVHVSALTRKHVLRLLPEIIQVNHERTKIIDPVELEKAFEAIKIRHLPVKGKGVHHPKIYSIKQLASSPPVFELRIKRKTDLHDTYLRYLERQIRRVFGFKGIPMVFYVKKA